MAPSDSRCRIVGWLALAAGLSAWPSAAAAGLPEDHRAWTLQAGVGNYRDQAAFLFGGGIGLFDDDRTRWELRGVVGISGAQTIGVDPASGFAGTGRVQQFTFLGELNVGWRRGQWEPWAGLGLATSSLDGTFNYTCALGYPGPCYATGGEGTQSSGSWVGGVTAAGGVRWLMTEALLLELELRYLPEGTSTFTTDVPASGTVGGFSAAAAVVWRVGATPAPATPVGAPRQGEASAPAPYVVPESTPGPAPAAPPAPEPAPEPPPAPPIPSDRPAPQPPARPIPPPAPAPPPAAAAEHACAAGRTAVFELHPQRRFRCYPDTVRGGFYCRGDGAVEAEFVARGACERGCAGGAAGCPAGGAASAACRRCVEGCAETRRLACVPENGGRDEGGGCAIEAGRWGLQGGGTVPVICEPAKAPE